MNRFDICIPRILKHEGGYVNHPNDPGGATNKGITIATYRRHINPKGTVADLKGLTEAQAAKVYKAEYWDKVRADELPVGVDYAVADFGVNSGPSRAIKHLQKAVGVTQDGRIGPQTIAAARKADPAAVVERITESRMEFLHALKTWPSFGKGWTSRVTSVRKAALADIASGKPATAPKSVSAPTPAAKVETGRPAPDLGWLWAILRFFGIGKGN